MVGLSDFDVMVRLALALRPKTAMGGAAAWLCFAGVYAVCLMVCYALYTLFVRRYEQRFA